MSPALDHAAELSDDLISGMDLLSLARVIHRYGPSHGIPAPSFDMRYPDENQASQMRQIGKDLCERARNA